MTITEGEITMKKYVKPELIFERFELSQQIAACDYKGSFSDESSCTFTGKNKEFNEVMTIFLDAGKGCLVETEDFCYYGSTGGYFNIFNS